jgi:hypothetical protein
MLEGDVFVGDFWAAGLATSARVVFFGGSGLIEIVAARSPAARSASTGSCSGIGARTEHLHGVRHDIETGALLTFLVLPFAGLNAAFDVDHRPFFQVLLADLGEFSPSGDAVPLGALLALPIAVFVGFVGGHGEIGDGLAASRIARFRIAAQAADENDLVYGHGPPYDGEDSTRGRKKEMRGEVAGRYRLELYQGLTEVQIDNCMEAA